jgi:hypothetical protein
MQPDKAIEAGLLCIGSGRDQSFAVRYRKDGALVRVLRYEWDEQCDAATQEIQQAAADSAAGAS